MPSERAAKALRDIQEAIAKIQEWVTAAGGAEAAIRDDQLVRSAIERQLLIISEAAIRLERLEQKLLEKAPEIDWPGVRGIGNFIRHRYDNLDEQTIIDVLKSRLPQLASTCDRLIVE